MGRISWERETAKTLPRRASAKLGFGRFLDVAQKRYLLEWASAEVDGRSLAIGPVTPSVQAIAEILAAVPFRSPDDAWEYLYRLREKSRQKL